MMTIKKKRTACAVAAYMALMLMPNAVWAGTHDSQVTESDTDSTVTVNVATSDRAYGVYNSGSGSEVTIGGSAASAVTINATASAERAYAVYTNNGATTIDAATIEINATSTSATDSNQGRGVVAEGKNNSDVTSKITLGSEASGSNIVINATGNANTNATIGIWAWKQGAVVEVNGESLTVNVDGGDGGSAFGILAQSNTQTETAPENAAKVIINAGKTTVNSTNIGLSTLSNGYMEINGDLEVTADHAIDMRGYSTMNINTSGENTVVLNGDIVFETDGSANKSGTAIDAYLNLNLTNEDSSWTGNTYMASSSDGDYEANGAINITLSNGATWNVTDVSDKFDDGTTSGETVQSLAVTNLTSDGGVISLTDDGAAALIDNLDGESLTVNTSSTDSSVTIGTRADETEINVVGSSSIADDIASGSASLQDLADVVTVTDEDSSNQKNVSVAEGTIAGAITAQTDEDGNIITSTISEATNTTNSTIGDMAAIGLMTWRQENNDMNKRLGELRDSKGEHGVWVRMSRGEAKYKGVKNEYNYYQLGYDEKLSTNPRWTVGAALTYTDAENSSGNVSGDNKHTGFAIYGSYLANDGSFLDLIAKYARLEYDFYAAGGVGNADYEANGYSISAEYGKRFTQDNGFWIEPQVELTYGTVGSASYTTANGATVSQDKMDSFVGRLGFAAGKNIKNGNVYVRASYLYDFDGETEARMSKSGVTRKYEYDIGGGWWEVGLGTNLNFSDSAHMYLDVEKTYGGDVSTPWQWNIGMRWSF